MSVVAVEVARNRHDAEIRGALLDVLGGLKETTLVQEWGIPNAVVDVATISLDMINGYEIKSAADSVTRLATQAPAYDAVFDLCTLVTTDNHLRHAERTLPAWWGLWAWRGGAFIQERPPSTNVQNNAARLLWSDELSLLLTEMKLRERAREEQHRIDKEWGFHVGCGPSCKGSRRPTKAAMMAAIPMSPEVRAWVARRLMARPGWRLANGRSARNYR